MAENRETTKTQGELLRRFALHLGMCQQCQMTAATKGQVKPCDIGYRLSMEWLEFQASHGDPSAAMYLQGIENASNLE